jgi:CRP/FNR family transcriptional regulator
MEAEQFVQARRSIPALADATLDLISNVAADQGTRIFELVALSARERIQAELLRLARTVECTGNRCVVRPAPTHQALADQIGATREVVTRTLRAMADEGLIRLERGAIEIVKVDRLGELDHAATGRRIVDPSGYLSTLFLVSSGIV